MPLNIILDILLGIGELLRLALLTSIPCFAIVLAAEQLHRRLSLRFKFSWAQATLVSTYLAVTLLIIFLYFIPSYLGWLESPLTGQPVPPELQATAADIAALLVFTAVKILASALAYTILLLPFIFFATYVVEKLKETGKLPVPANKFIAVFASALLAWIILLFIFPFAWGGLLYLLFWS
jgi:hypothetical protein